MSEFDERIKAKESIINELKNLDASVPSLGSKVRVLREKFYDCGNCGIEENKRLKDEFDAAANVIFEEREKMRGNIAERKKALVEQAESLADSTDFKAAKEQLKALQEQWKQEPRASREEEEELWKSFKAAADRLYDNAHKDYEERLKQQDAGKEIKQDLVNKAEEISTRTDFKDAIAEMKELQKQWKEAPRASKEDEDMLWPRFKEAADRLFENAHKDYEERRQVGEQKHKEYLERLQERVRKSREFLEKLEKAISVKEEQLGELQARTEPNLSNPHWLDIVQNRNQRVAELKDALKDMRAKRLEVTNQIAEMESKLKPAEV